MTDGNNPKNESNVPLKKDVGRGNKAPPWELRHRRWVAEFIALPQWKNHYPDEPTRNYGLSKSDRAWIKKQEKLEKQLVAFSEKLECRAVKKPRSAQVYNYSVRAEKSGGAFRADALENLLNAIRADINLMLREHDVRTRGKERVIPRFVAEHILLGLATHRKLKDTGERKEGYSAMREYFARDGEFQRWYQKTFDGDKVSDALSSARGGKNCTQWAKQMGQEMKRQIEAASR